LPFSKVTLVQKVLFSKVTLTRIKPLVVILENLRSKFIQNPWILDKRASRVFQDDGGEALRAFSRMIF
jgi:hypothetical protein